MLQGVSAPFEEGDFVYITRIRRLFLRGHPQLSIIALQTPGYAIGIAVSGTYAYIAAWTAGLQVVDIADPTHPTIVGSLQTPGYAWTVSVMGLHAYVVDRYSGLRVVDITNPSSPFIVGSVDVPNYGRDVVLSGNYAYVVSDAGLRIIDISNPNSPVIVGTVDTPDPALAVALGGSYVYIAEWASGLRVIDVANSRAPRIVGGIDVAKQAEGVAVSGSDVYVVDQSTGLLVFPAQCSVTAIADPPTGSFYPNLASPSPNPSVGSITRISFFVKQHGRTQLRILDSNGRIILTLIDEPLDEGTHTVTWDGKDERGRPIASGVYQCEMETMGFHAARKLVKLR